MTGNSEVEQNVPVAELAVAECGEHSTDPSTSPESQREKQADTSQEEETKIEPDVDLGTLQLFTVGGVQAVPAKTSGAGREGSSGSEKGKVGRQKRLNVSSKVGHIEHSSPDAVVTLGGSPASQKVEKHQNNSTNGKINRSARHIWVSLKRKLRTRRGEKETAVKEIHILPEEGEDKWANRSLSDRSSTSSRAGSSGSRGNRPGIIVVKEARDAVNQDNLHSPEKKIV